MPDAAAIEREILADLALGIEAPTVQDIADRLDAEPQQVEDVLRALVFSSDVRIDASGPGAWRYLLRGRPVRFGQRAEGVA